MGKRSVLAIRVLACARSVMDVLETAGVFNVYASVF